MVRLFKGGIHPYGKKESTKKKTLALAEFPPSRIVLPLFSPQEEVLEPLVAEGDLVKLGQAVAKGEADSTMEIFSGVSGTVSKIGQEPHPLFGQTPAIVISNDFKDTQISRSPCQHPEKLRPDEIVNLLRARGVRETNYEETPIYQKLQRGRHKAKILIINAVEAEPYLTADHRLLLDRLEMVVRGSLLLKEALDSENIIFAIQGDKIDGVEALEESPFWDRDFMKVKTLPTRYPYGAENQVISFVTGKELRKEQSSLEAECMVFTLGGVHAVGEAILLGKEQTHRAVTVSGGCVKRPRNFWLPIGSPIESVFVNGEGLKEDPAFVILGGPMTGQVQRDFRAPLLLGSPALLALAKWEIPKHLLQKSEPTMPCIHCGHCLHVCPMHLAPNMVYRQMKQETPEEGVLAKLHPSACIACGSCNYRCPAQLPLAQAMAEAEDLVALYLVAQREQRAEALEKKFFPKGSEEGPPLQTKEKEIAPPEESPVLDAEETLVLLLDDEEETVERDEASSEAEPVPSSEPDASSKTEPIPSSKEEPEDAEEEDDDEGEVIILVAEPQEEEKR